MRWATVLALLTASVFLAGCGGSKVTATTTVAPETSQRTTTIKTTTSRAAPTTTNVVIEVGKHGVKGGPVHARLQKGQRVILIVRSALADEVHVHGYDLKADVPANGHAAGRPWRRPDTRSTSATATNARHTVRNWGAKAR